MHLIVEETIAKEAGSFALQLIPGLFPFYSFKVLSKYLQTQHVLGPLASIGIMANALNAFFNWSLIFQSGWRIVGSPWAMSLTRILECALVVGYMFCKRNTLLKDTWLKL